MKASDLDPGLAAYARGAYFEAHELWEAVWRRQPPGDERRHLQGLIQIAVAMHKAVVDDKPAAAARILERALAKLAGAPAVTWGLRVDLLRVACCAARRALGDRGALDPSAVPTIARAADGG